MFRFLLLLILGLSVSFSKASPLSKDNLPEPLIPWVDWVLQDQNQFHCPFLSNDFLQKKCQWPGKLILQLESKRGQFSSYWQIYGEGWVTLPGNQQFWPQQVTVDNLPAIVISKQGKPVVKLIKGSHLIKGLFIWDHIPENLAIPMNTGLLSLQINHKSIHFPTIKNNLLWLKESDKGRATTKNIENKLKLKVYRKIVDQIPLQLISFLELDISGDQREIHLPYALLPEFIPVSLNSPLPARIEADGRLLIQVRPGRWHIELTARYPGPVSQLGLKVNDKQWPASEIWSFEAQPSLRLLEIDNVKTVDPGLSNVPRQWRKLPAYLVKQGESLHFKVIRRGDPMPEPNQLSLQRQLWLDFDGRAYTVADTISGKMTQGWRLNALPETQLGQVKLNGQSQLITLAEADNKQGIEIRRGNITVHADSRIEHDISNFSAVGWEQDFKKVSAELNIPPGWQLLAASGVDNVPASWISRWTLLDIFLVLIAALAISQLWNIFWGCFALVTLVLCWHEIGAPHYIWLNILAAIALIRVLPQGRLQSFIKGYRNLCWLGLLIIVIPFLVAQVRTGLYPQLEKQWQAIMPISVKSMPIPQAASDIAFDKAAGFANSLSKLQSRQGTESLAPVRIRQKKIHNIDEIDPDANIQTGPGLPQWQWKKIQLSWNGTVDSQQYISLWYLNPTASMLLNFIRVILILILCLRVFDLLSKPLKLPPFLLSWLLIIPFSILPVQDVFADFPDQKLLDDLKNRLLQKPECVPQCVQIAKMQLSIDEQTVKINLQVHAQQALAFPLPARLNDWVPNIIQLGKDKSASVIRTRDGRFWLQIDKGIHTIKMQGLVPVQQKFSLPLPLKPHFSEVNSHGWTVEGIHEHGHTDRQLVFNRLNSQKRQAGDNKLEAGNLPAFIRIKRTLSLGLDWRMTTRVIRLNKNDSALTLNVPLLKGESVTTENIRVKNNQVFVNMSARQQSVQWQSVLKKSAQIDLIASPTQQWTETWQANISPIWHINITGISVVHHQDRGRWVPEWRPWPGEKVSLMITRPKAVPGSTLTIERADLLVKPGKRTVQSDLSLTLNSSKGTLYTLTLPDQVQLQTVMLNGVTQPIRQKDRHVTLPIKPGTQKFTLQWQKKQAQSAIFSTPEINLAKASVNNHLQVIFGQDRWVLFTSGPKFGPAVLIWGVLIVIAILSLGLGRIPITPLKHWHWFLLLIGLSQIPISFALCVVFWFVALGIKENNPLSDPRYFNALQIVLVMLTLTSLLLLFLAVQQGLLGSPDMQITGNHSTAYKLNWYQDRSHKLLPTATVISLPVMVYRILMLLWSLWLAVSLLNWLKWGWACFATAGLWKKANKSVKDSALLANSKKPEKSQAPVREERT